MPGRLASSLTSLPVLLVYALFASALVVFAVAWSPARVPEPLLVADLRGRVLLVVDPADPASVRRIDLPGGPHELLQLPDDRVLVSLEQSGMLAMVDLDTEDVESIEVGGVPHGLALEEDPALGAPVVLVTDRSVDRVRRFTLDGWRELSPIEAGSWPHAVGVGLGGSTLVASAGAGSVSLGSHAVFVGGTTETLAVRGDGAVAAAAATDGLVVLLAPDGSLLGRWEVGGRPVRVMFSPDGDTLAVALSADHAVALIAGDKVRRVPVEGVPDGLAFSSDGRVLYASDVYGGAVTAVDVSSAAVRAVLAVGEGTGALLVTR